LSCLVFQVNVYQKRDDLTSIVTRESAYKKG
jgi:hypothetical protein